MQLVLNVVRGIEPWTVLKKFGVYCTKNYCNGTQWHFSLYQGDPILPTADDLIMGFKNHSKNMAALEEWASFMLFGDNITDFEDIENDPRGDELTGYLWQATFREFDVPPLKQFLEKCREDKDREDKDLEETKA